MGRISAGLAIVKGIKGVMIFVPAGDIAARVESEYDVIVTDPHAFCKAFSRELSRENITTEYSDVQSILACAFDDAIDEAINNECRGFVSGDEYREQQARCEPQRG